MREEHCFSRTVRTGMTGEEGGRGRESRGGTDEELGEYTGDGEDGASCSRVEVHEDSASPIKSCGWLRQSQTLVPGLVSGQNTHKSRD